MTHFNGRLRKAARLNYHWEYGGYIPAQFRSARELAGMNLTPEEEHKVKQITEWMVKQVTEKGRWF